MLSLLLVGCLESPPPAGDVPRLSFLADIPSDPIIERTLKPEPDPFFEFGETPPPVEPPPAESLPPVGFTGARVYGDATSCNPCRNIASDLRFLRDFHGWKISDSADVPADWQILPARQTDRLIPRIEFLIDGEVIDAETGYSDAATFAERRLALLDLVARHPSRLQKEH